MKKIVLFPLYVMLVFFTSSGASVYAEGFVLSSPDIAGQLSMENVFNGFGCKGKNLSPKLNWVAAPKNTRSFAITVYDPDAPTGSGWWHWVIFDIPSDIMSLERNAGNTKAAIAPKESVQSITSFGTAGFGGACPPQGDTPHQYQFTIYALKVDKLGLDSNATPAMVGFYLNNNILAKASIVAYYGR